MAHVIPSAWCTTMSHVDASEPVWPNVAPPNSRTPSPQLPGPARQHLVVGGLVEEVGAGLGRVESVDQAHQVGRRAHQAAGPEQRLHEPPDTRLLRRCR